MKNNLSEFRVVNDPDRATHVYGVDPHTRVGRLFEKDSFLYQSLKGLLTAPGLGSVWLVREVGFAPVS